MIESEGKLLVARYYYIKRLLRTARDYYVGGGERTGG